MRWIPKGKISRSFLVIFAGLYGLGLWKMPSSVLGNLSGSPVWAKITIIPIVIGILETGIFLVTSPDRMQDYVDRKGWFLTQEEFYFLNEYNEKTWLLDENEKNLALNLDKLIKSGKKQEYLKNLTNFEWDDACYFPSENYMLTALQQKYLEEYNFNKKIYDHSIIFFNKNSRIAYVFSFETSSMLFINNRTHECKNKDDLIVKINEFRNFELVTK